MDHILGVAVLQIGPGEIEKILLGLQDSSPLVVKIQEGLQIVELIGGAQALDIGIWQRNPIAFGQGEQEFRLQGTLNMQV